MTLSSIQETRWRALILVAVILAGGGGYWLGTRGSDGSVQEQASQGRSRNTLLLRSDVSATEIRGARQIAVHGYAACSEICRR